MNALYPPLAKVLIVDDNSLDRFVGKRTLEKLNIATSIDDVESAQDALIYLTACAREGVMPDLVLLDVNMPIMSGLEMLKEMCQIQCLQGVPLRIVLLTSSIHPNDREEARRLGVQGYLEKPLSKERICSLLAPQSAA